MLWVTDDSGDDRFPGMDLSDDPWIDGGENGSVWQECEIGDENDCESGEGIPECVEHAPWPEKDEGTCSGVEDGKTPPTLKFS